MKGLNMNTATTETAKNDTLEFAKELAKAYAIPAATGEKLDKMYAYREDRDEDNDVECPACPVLNEAQELSSFLLSVCDDECRARAIDGNPWNGVDYQGLRARALFTLRQVDRYLAARKARFGVEEGQPVPRQAIEAEREMHELP
jgi:hypothetical protein